MVFYLFFFIEFLIILFLLGELYLNFKDQKNIWFYDYFVQFLPWLAKELEIKWPAGF